MKRIVLVLSMLLCASNLYSHSNRGSTQAPKNYVFRFEETSKDDNQNAINLDSVQFANLKGFLTDSCYRDSIIRMSLNASLDNIKGSALSEEKPYHTEKWVRIMLIALAFLLVACVIYLVLLFRGLSKEIDEIKRKNNSFVEDYYILKNRLNNIPHNSSSSSKTYDKEIEKLNGMISALENKLVSLENTPRDFEKEQKTIVSDQSAPIQRPVESQKLLYSDSIIDHVFSHVLEQENEDTVFVLKLKNDTTASFTISRKAYDRVIANPSFLDGCDRQILGKNTVEIVSEGEAEKRINGKWTVTSPLKVEI